MLLSQYVGNLKIPQIPSDAYTEDKILERIAPIGSIRTEPVLADSSASEKDASVTKVALSGRRSTLIDVLLATRLVLNAPKIGDTAVGPKN